MFLDPEVDGIICARGGYGCTRILDQINYDYIAQNPKVLVGFSDITALANTIHEKTGLITFHGPVGTTLDNEYSRRNLSRIITKSTLELNISAEHYSRQTIQADDTFEQYVINPGVVTAKLIGGNLSLLSAMCGTEFDLDYTGKLVFIEDIDEDPYSVDRMFTQLLSAPTFKHAAGIVLGVFKGCNEPERMSFSIKEVILDRIKSLNVPSIYGYSIGHIDRNLTLPIGIQASLNTESFSITLKENAVRD
jgi:muramoyltetrapeptide carboxypeptidase